MEILSSNIYEQSIQPSTDIAISSIKDNNQGSDLLVGKRTKGAIKDDVKGEVDINEIEDLINKSNKQMLVYDRRLDISVHEKTRQVMVKVVDVKTDEIIREIPPEKVLDIKAKLTELRGIMLDKKI